jgi:hypothetical protein
VSRPEEELLPELAGGVIPAPHMVPATEVSQFKACSITEPDCEACQ